MISVTAGLLSDLDSRPTHSGVVVDICKAYSEHIASIGADTQKNVEDPSSKGDFEELWREALEISGSCVLQWQPAVSEGIVLYMPSMFGYDKKEKVTMSQQDWLAGIHPGDRRRHFHEVKNFLASSNQDTFHSEYRVQKKDGDYVWVGTYGKVKERDADGLPLRIIGRHTDISDRKIKEDQIKYQSTHDGLTNLLNRNTFLSIVDEKLKIFSKENPTGKAAILILNIRSFKNINEKYQYQGGDQILQQVAKKLQEILRSDDIISRLGGDEFALFIPDATEAGLEKIARKIGTCFRESFIIKIDSQNELFVDDLQGKMAVSIFPEHSTNAEELLSKADIALQYQHNPEGKDLYFYDEKMSVALYEAQKMTNDLKRAVIAEGQLYPAYQVIVDKEGKAQSFESLIRWNHPEKGNIPPINFIPLAEETKLIINVGAKMLHDVCLQIRTWRDAGYDPPRVAVNVSVLQLTEGDFFSTLQQVLEKTGISPEKLTLEITESMLMTNFEATTLLLQKMRNLGIEISLDDFGTGYSSLSVLPKLPIDKMKIDRSFINDLTSTDAGKNNTARILCQSIISLAHLLGKTVVAEGIETEEHFQILKAMDCDYYQGYYFSRPIKAAEVKNEWITQEI